MVHMEPVAFGTAGHAIAITVTLPRTTLVVVTTGTGYVMCGALDVRLLDERLAARGIVAARAVGVRTVAELLDAPLEDVTRAAEAIGVRRGMRGRDAVLCMLSAGQASPAP